MKYISKKDISNNKVSFIKRLKIYFLNKIYLKKEEILSLKILNNVNGYSLDKEQRKAVLLDEDSLLVVAGAGSGKTLTMMGKIRYLVERKKVDPKKILVLSFTNFTTNSFKKSISKNIDYNIEVLTFHKLGISILKNAGYKFKICSEKLLEKTIQDYLKNELLINQTNLYKFLHYYVIDNEELLYYTDLNMNYEEKVIGNFLYCNNIKFEYKPIKIINNKVLYAFYLIDYNLYIKHELMNDIFEDKDYDNNFIVTNSYIFTYEDIFKYLYDELSSKNVKFDDSNYLKICDIFLLKGNKIKRLTDLIVTFINMLKSSNYDIKKIDEMRKTVMKMSKKMERERLLFTLDIIEKIYINYEANLYSDKEIDFNDIINKSSEIIKKGKVILNYDYIIIDEFQDTSICRYELIKSIKEITEAKLVAVGDDFQSIYRFTGCDIKMFLNFEKYFKYSKKVYITNTYRNSNELVKVAGNFIMKNKFQMKKILNSNKNLDRPIKIYFYDDKNEINNLFFKIKESNIFVLGRNNKDISYLDNLSSNKNIQFMSVHKSKGLESSAVVIVNLTDNITGFPSKCKEDILISYLCNNKDYYPYEEERRLFYVALTRTKNNVYLFVPNKNPSIFVKELVNNYKKYIEFIN